MGEPRRLVEILTLPYKTAQTIYEGSSEVRRYVNSVTGVEEIGKRVHKLGLEDCLGFKEATLLQTLRHDHLVPVYTVVSVFEPNSDPLFTTIEMIMPYYPRGSVFDVLIKQKQRFGMSEAVRLARDFLLGLDYLHEQHRLLHRDMKSANVFVDLSGRGRIGDLGVSVPMGPDGAAEAFQMGLQMYTAPEAFPTKRADRQTDIYGVGLILYEMLNGPFPYDDYENEPLERRLDKGKRAMRDEHLAFKPHVPRRLRAIVTKAISRKPTDRFATAREMMDAIGKARFIDWEQVAGEEFTWEGIVPGVPEIGYQVSATRMKRPECWRLSGKKRTTEWRRCVQDQDVTDLSDKSARDFFDQMVSEATSL